MPHATIYQRILFMRRMRSENINNWDLIMQRLTTIICWAFVLFGAATASNIGSRLQVSVSTEEEIRGTFTFSEDELLEFHMHQNRKPIHCFRHYLLQPDLGCAHTTDVTQDTCHCYSRSANRGHVRNSPGCCGRNSNRFSR